MSESLENPAPPQVHKSRMVPVESLRGHPRNYRAHPEDQLAHIKESITRHGFYRNIVVARDGTILAGHGVWQAARELGMEQVPAIFLELGPDDPLALKVIAGDNEIGKMSVVDDRVLTEMLKEIQEADVGLLGTGFDEKSLAALLYVTRPASEIPSEKEAGHWVGMPEFGEADSEFKLTLSFLTKEARDAWVAEQAKVGFPYHLHYRTDSAWSAWWPPKERSDLASVKFLPSTPAAEAAEITVREPIPRRLFRVWCGPAPIPLQHEEWWKDFQRLNPGWEFITVTDATAEEYMPAGRFREMYEKADSYGTRSNYLRACVLPRGGIYIDTDFLPLKPLDELTTLVHPFACKRSSKSFECAVLGSPAGHPLARKLVDEFPDYVDGLKKVTCVTTGPQYFSAKWFGNPGVVHLPTVKFYPFNGFMAPKREEKERMFLERKFPAEMLAAHFSNMRWGGKPQ